MTRLKATATAAPAPAVRTRQRPTPKTAAVVAAAEALGIPTVDVKLNSGTKKPTKVMRDRVRDYAPANVAMNAAKRITDKEKKLLWPEMSEAGFVIGDGGFTEKVTIGGMVREFRAEIVEPDKQKVDVVKLLELVGKDKFMEIVSATQDAVTDAVGGNILNQCLVTVKGDVTLSIKEVK